MRIVEKIRPFFSRAAQTLKTMWGRLALLSAGVLILGVCLFAFSGSHEGMLRIPFDAAYPIGKDCDDMAAELEKAGFTQIKVKDDYTGWEQGNSVLKLAVNNSEKFSRGDYVDKDVTVLITRSSPERLDASAFLGDWQEADHETVAERLKAAGFTNITLQEVETREKEENRRISRLELNRITYANGHCCIPMDAPIEIAYYGLKIRIGSTNETFAGRDYPEVVKELEAAGFTDIETKEITDGWAKGNTVVNVRINDQRHYSVDALFEPEAKILVEYSSNDRIDATACLAHWQETGYQEVKTRLEEAGFTNVTAEYLATMEQEENQAVLSVKLNDAAYTEGACYLQKDTPIALQYGSLRIVVGKGASAFVDQQYKTVVKELQSKGFTNIVLKRANDLITGWLTEEGTVKEITIDNCEGFTDTDLFSYDAQIVIVVHTFKYWGCKEITEAAE